MSLDYFVSVLRDKYAALDPSIRKQKIRELVSESAENRKFIQQHFPQFFAEAFAPTVVAQRPKSAKAKMKTKAKPKAKVVRAKPAKAPKRRKR